ncbi:hypothetical protein HZA26_04385 [Candidatus Nomurabacteria bacterium]|nr:hypothetical protein [Candidatus Nomurabacteria bacterium]
MIYLFAGDDVQNKHKAYAKFLSSIKKGTEVFFISRNDFNKAQIENFYSGVGLFFSKCVVIFSGALEREEIRDFVLEKLELMVKSENDFVFLDGKLNKSVLDVFKKIKPSQAEINIFELPKIKLEKFDNFLLANAFGEKDRLKLWLYFRMAVDRGVMMEELSGVLFWKAKDMMIKNNFNKFSEKELQKFTSKLAYLLPEARSSGLDAETVFEQFLLEAF